MSEISPLNAELLYNTIVLAGVLSPGLVTLSEHDDDVNWDVKKAKGQKGASITRQGRDPVTFLATFFLADQEDFDAWPAFRAVIETSVTGTTPKALDIYHPDLAEQGIKSVAKAKILGRKHDGKGGQTIGVKFIEYLPPQPAGGSPSGSKSKPKKATPDPDAAALAELAKLAEQYKNTPFGRLAA